MEPETRPRGRAIWVVIAGLVIGLFGVVVFRSGWWTLQKWSSISSAYAACGVVALLAGIAMMGAGLWALVSLGRYRLPILLGGLATALFGVVTVAGTVTNVIPCAGPS
jgi:hypothetical protein